MKKVILFVLAVTSAVFFIACGGAAVNKPVAENTNTANANTAAPGAPTKEALIALERSAWEAWKNKDTKFWDGFLSERYAGVGPTGRTDKVATIKFLTDPKTEVKSYSFSDEQMKMLGEDAALLTFKVTQDYTNDGKPGPKEVWAASIYLHEGDKWKSGYYNDVAVLDPKAAPAKPAGEPIENKPAAETNVSDPSTEILLGVEKKAWDAWKARDQKAIEPVLTKDLVTVEPSGRYDYAGTMKLWFDTKCEIKSYTLTDASSASMTKDMSLLIFKAAVDGNCGGQPIGSTQDTSAYVRDGDNWTLAFAFNSPPQ